MTGERLAELKALASAASPGPWTFFGPAPHSGFCCVLPVGTGRYVATVTNGSRETVGNAAFIATARQAVPELIAEVERLRALFRERES